MPYKQFYNFGYNIIRVISIIGNNSFLMLNFRKLVDKLALTEKQKTFCRNIVSGMSNKDSYLSAYNSNSDNAAWIESTKLLQKDEIQEYIKALSKPIEIKAQTTAISEREKKRAILWTFINDQSREDNTRLKAMDLLNKMDAEYININRNIEETTELNNLDIDTLKKLSDSL